MKELVPGIPRERLAAFAAITLVFLAMLWPERAYVPIWDGRVYADCVIDAARSGLSFESLRCARHPTQAWAAVLAIPQLLHPGDVRILHLTDALLGILALACIRVALRRVFPEPALARQLDLVTLACAVHPVVLSTLVQVNIDFGVYVFFFAALAALLAERFLWTAVAGLLLCFAKETGVLAYAVMIGLDAAFRAAGTAGTWSARVRSGLRSWVTMLPLVVFAVHVRLWDATHPVPAVWKHGWQKQTMDGFKFFDLSDPVFASYAAGIFVLGFLWAVSAIIASDLAVGGVRMARRLPVRPVPGADRARLAYLTVLTVVLTYLLTSFRTWSNLRYFALLYPLLVILAFAALLRLDASPRVRTGALAAIVALFVFAAFRSADPVSRGVYGTFSIGEREMYRMASITGEYAGPGRDELVYNLEFTGYDAAQNALFRQLRPTASTVIATGRAALWNIFSPLDAVTFRRTLRSVNVVTPRYRDDEGLRAAATTARPHELWFLEFSYRPDADTSLRSLAGNYRETAVMRATAGGHVVVAHRFEMRTP
ncbi:MAG: hypothetical protein ACHQQ3_01345 [Gemmatimonadales bacterium]